jgi:hypothetical protein
MPLACRIIVMSCLAASAAGPALSEVADACRTRPLDAQSAQPETLDARAMFDQVVSRYHGLAEYEDSANVEQVTTRQGEDPRRTQTTIACSIDSAGELHVRTPGSQVREGVAEGVGVGGAIETSPPLAALQRRYHLWLAPHMSLRFAKDPLKEFRAGIDEGFTPVKAERVTIDDRELVKVELKSGDGLSENCRARFNLFINPESMLVVRVEGTQLLPDGAQYETTLQITPVRAESGAVRTPAASRTTAA